MKDAGFAFFYVSVPDTVKSGVLFMLLKKILFI